MTYEMQSTSTNKFVVQNNISLANKNWFQTGGAARFFTAPRTTQQLADAIAYAKDMSAPVFLLGAGANVLISDSGFDGLVIQPQIKTISYQIIDESYAQVTAGAGVAISDLIEYCLANQLLGLEEFSGIPGTVGGAVYINLHYFNFFIADFLTGAQVVCARSGALKIVTHDWFAFEYNKSSLHDGGHYLAEATFRLKRASQLERAYARGRRNEIIRQRAQRYPTSHTCGSFFRNFYDHEVTIENNGKKMVCIAYYLDKIGVKGQLRIGGAQVSYQHANMIVNIDRATSGDIIAVARKMQELVFDHFGIMPQPECRLVGFKEYPLLKDKK